MPVMNGIGSLKGMAAQVSLPEKWIIHCTFVSFGELVAREVSAFAIERPPQIVDLQLRGPTIVQLLVVRRPER